MDGNIIQEIQNRLLSHGRYPFDADHIELKPSITNESSVLTFTYKKTSNSGFDIYAEFYLETYNIYIEFIAIKEFYALNKLDSIEYIVDLLDSLANGDIIMEITLVGNKPINHKIVNSKNGKVIINAGTMFYNYFGKKRKEIKTNQTLK